MKDIVTIDFTVHKPMDTTKCTHRYFPLFEDVKIYYKFKRFLFNFLYRF